MIELAATLFVILLLVDFLRDTIRKMEDRDGERTEEKR